jgi:deoxycytidylate deaminase
MVKDGQVISRAGNGFNQGPQIHVCPRIVLECPTGTGYELCTLHDSPGHAEQMLLQVAHKKGIDPSGSDIYLYGHWWACEPCWTVMIDAGIRDVYLTDDAHERFSREKVYGQTLNPSIKTISLERFDEKMTDEILAYIKEFGLQVVEERGDVHCVMEESGVQCVLAGESTPVFTIELSDNLARQVRNVLRQL